MTVPCAEGAGEEDSIETDSGVGESEAGGGSVGDTSVGETALVLVDSGGGVQAANIEFAATKLPVTDTINFKASRHDNLPSS
jgi:hypothetical protein